jgi:prepilin-type N-terminal cleavage/methylation domain-containing protein/prepilin-type processing-associated H-X9-DG protein
MYLRSRFSYTSNNVARTEGTEGFTLVEVLVALGVISILLGIALPAVQSVRDAALRAQCANNEKQIGLALHNYHDTFQQLPPLPARPGGPSGSGNDPNRILSWRALILPFVEQANLWTISEQACRVDGIPLHNPPHVGYSTLIRTYTCPADSRQALVQQDPWYKQPVALTEYLGVSGYSNLGAGIFGPSTGITFAQVEDGLSFTLMVGERPPPESLQAGQWYSNVSDSSLNPFAGPNGYMSVEEPYASAIDPCRFAGRQYGPGRLANPCDRYHFWSLHLGGSNFLFGDGGVRFIPYSARNVLPAYATRAGGEVVPSLD